MVGLVVELLGFCGTVPSLLTGLFAAARPYLWQIHLDLLFWKRLSNLLATQRPEGLLKLGKAKSLFLFWHLSNVHRCWGGRPLVTNSTLLNPLLSRFARRPTATSLVSPQIPLVCNMKIYLVSFFLLALTMVIRTYKAAVIQKTKLHNNTALQVGEQMLLIFLPSVQQNWLFLLHEVEELSAFAEMKTCCAWVGIMCCICYETWNATMLHEFVAQITTP